MGYSLPESTDQQRGRNQDIGLMVWHDANRLPWGVLILFSGGLSLASAVSSTGLALWLGEALTA